MISFSIRHLKAFRNLLYILTERKELILEMTWREINQKYVGHVLGMFWSIGMPLFLMTIYVTVFTYVFKIRMGEQSQIPSDFSVYMLSGLIPWIAFMETMGTSVSVVPNNANLVKQVVFPLEVLPAKSALATMPTQAISMIILLMYIIFKYGSVPITILLLPLLFIFQTLAMIGVSYLFSSIGAYFRDLKELVGLLSSVGIFILPVLYPPNMTPLALKVVLVLNPFSYMIWCYQDVFFYGEIRHPGSWILFSSGSLALFYFGYKVFNKLKVMFGDVL